MSYIPLLVAFDLTPNVVRGFKILAVVKGPSFDPNNSMSKSSYLTSVKSAISFDDFDALYSAT